MDWISFAAGVLAGAYAAAGIAFGIVYAEEMREERGRSTADQWAMGAAVALIWPLIVLRSQDRGTGSMST